MLSIRGKTAFIILGVAVLISGSTLGVGWFIAQNRFTIIVRATLSSVSRIASGMVSSELGRLKEETRYIAEKLSAAENVQEILDEQLRQHPSHLSFSVMSGAGGATLHAGPFDTEPAPAARVSRYALRAFAGETVVTSTSHTPDSVLIMRIWTPIDAEHVLVTTLPGLYLSEFLAPHTIWETSGIFVMDGSGTYVAGSRYHYRIQERRSHAERDMRYRISHRRADFHTRILESDSGEGLHLFTYIGRRMFGSSRPIQGTDNWSLEIMAPLSGSPLFHVRKLLLMSVSIIIVLGIIAAVCASNTIAKPYEKMTELKLAAEAASNSKTQFLANMSHEIRTPLSSIIGISEIELGSTKLRGDSFINVEKIHSAGMTMLAIINDLLDVSKIESGRLLLTPVVYDVPSMINDTFQLNIFRIGGKPVKFQLSVDEDIPSKLKGDELRVKQIFNNLLSNAFKYTEAGLVEWNILCAREGSRVKITSTIRDTGIGVRKEDQCKLFKDYSQVNVRDNYYVEGTGLGLSITKNLVALMGGSISLESDYLKGSSFTVEFYQEAAGNEAIGKDTATNLSLLRYSAQRNLQNRKIVKADMSYAKVLVVDDVVSNLEIVKGLLKPYKIGVDTAESGNEAIALVMSERVRYDAIFLDHMMPDMDGMQTAKAIREEIDGQYAKTVPIIALTANALVGNDMLYLENGFQAYLSKPIDVRKLDQILCEWVRNEEKEKTLSRIHVPKEQTEKRALGAALSFSGNTIPGINLSKGLVHLRNNKAAYMSVLSSFVKHTPGKIDILRNMETDLVPYRITVHGIKGSSRGIGAEKLGELASKLEKAAANGDREYILANNPAFVEATEKLIGEIKFFLDAVSNKDADGGKPKKERPEPEILQEILGACIHYDMLALRRASEALAAFDYTSAPELAQWITEQSHLSNFDAIQKRVASFVAAGK